MSKGGKGKAVSGKTKKSSQSRSAKAGLQVSLYNNIYLVSSRKNPQIFKEIH